MKGKSSYHVKLFSHREKAHFRYENGFASRSNTKQKDNLFVSEVGREEAVG